MKKLIILGPGNHGKNYNLLTKGYDKLTHVSKKISKLKNENDKSCYILTAPYSYCVVSATIIEQEIGIFKTKTREHGELIWSEDNMKKEYLFSRALEIIKSRSESIIILIPSHPEFIEKFVQYFAKNELQMEVETSKIGHAEGFMFNIEEKSFRFI